MSPTRAPRPCWDRQAPSHNRLGEQRRVDRREFGPGVPLQIVVDRDDSFDMRGFARPISALGSFRIAAADIERAPAEEEAVALRPSGAADGTPSHFQPGAPDVRMIHSRYVARRLQHRPKAQRVVEEGVSTGRIRRTLY